MKAMVYTAPQTLEYMDVADPVLAPGDVLIEVAATGICGSELHGIRHTNPFRVPPLIMGHEFSGTRVDTGEFVVVNPLISCGACDLCLSGRTNICRNRIILGISRSGGFAERVAVPLTNLYPAPKGLDRARGAFAEPIANAVHAWHAISHLQPERVGIIGAGSAGLSLLMVLKSFEVPTIHVADYSVERRNVASQLGAHAALSSLVDEYDIVIDAVGKSLTRSIAIERVRAGGIALWLGLDETSSDFDAQVAIRSEKSIQTSFCYTAKDFAEAVQIAAGVDASWIEMRPLSDGVEIFQALMHGRTDITKVALCP